MIAQRTSAWVGSTAASMAREFPFSNCRIIISERPAPWRQHVKNRLDHLCQLAPGWDGYNGRPVNFTTASFALNILESVCTHDTPAPSLVPGAAGDLQIEWHTSAWDIEIDITGPFRVAAWRKHVFSRQEDELTLTNDFTAVRGWIGSLMELPIAYSSAAA